MFCFILLPIFPVPVSRAREAALDAQFLVLASNLGKEKASELHSEMTAFDSLVFAEDLVSFGLFHLPPVC